MVRPLGQKTKYTVISIASRLHHHADDLVLNERWVDSEPGIEGAEQALGHDIAGAPVDLDLRDRGPVGHVVSAKPDAPSDRDIATARVHMGGLHGRPVGRRSRGVEHAEPAWISDVTAAEGQWINPCCVGE